MSMPTEGQGAVNCDTQRRVSLAAVDGNCGLSPAHSSLVPLIALIDGARHRAIRRSRVSRLVEPPTVDPHGGWCGGWGRETPGYPIGRLAVGVLDN